jgi:hypothetical protein
MRSLMISTLAEGDISSFAKDMHASHVIRKALDVGDESKRSLMISKLVERELMNCSEHKYSHHVLVKELWM